MSCSPLMAALLAKQLHNAHLKMDGKPPSGSQNAQTKAKVRRAGEVASDRTSPTAGTATLRPVQVWIQAGFARSAGEEPTASPVSTEILQAALAAVQAKKRDALPVKDQRAQLLAQARSLADKMAQQTKLMKEAAQKREHCEKTWSQSTCAWSDCPKRNCPCQRHLLSLRAVCRPGAIGDACFHKSQSGRGRSGSASHLREDGAIAG
eukprot:4975394-Amphidinium_carterae.1